MWPLSCYSYGKECPCLPGLIDVSPEEVRLAAYLARSSGTWSAFVHNLEELGKNQISVQLKYGTITAEQVQKLVSQ